MVSLCPSMLLVTTTTTQSV